MQPRPGGNNSDSAAPLLIAIMGPTGTGKSDLAERLADELDAELFNADAFQVYQGLDIGTNKPPVESRDRYHLLDLVPVTHDFGVGEWIKRITPLLETAYQNKKHCIIVGGTGFYIRALFEEFDSLMPPPEPGLREKLESTPLSELLEKLKDTDPETYNTIDRQNPIRVTRALEKALSTQPPIKIQLPSFQKLKFGLQPDDAELKEILNKRTDFMLKNGWIEEVRKILAQEIPISSPGLRAIGYHPLIKFCEGISELEEARADIVTQTWQYAKRQKTWLRSEPDLIPVPVIPLSSSGIEIAFHAMKSKTLEVLG